MTKYKRGNSLWTKFQYKGKRYQFKINPAVSPYETRDKVKQLVDEGHENVRISDGVAIVKASEFEKVITYRDYIDNLYDSHWKIYTKDHLKTFCKAATIGNYLGAIAYRSLREIDSDVIKDLTNRLLSSGRARSTVNRYLAVLKFVLNRAYDDGIIDRVPKIKMFKEPKGRIRVLTDEELRKLSSFCTTNGFTAAGVIFQFLVNTGLRLNEVLNLTRSVDDGLLYKIFIKDHKTGNNREIPLNESAASIIANYPHYFNGSVKESHLRSVWNVFKRVNEITDKDFVIHSLRHTFASKLINKGVSIFTVKELLGHKSIKTTERYCHLNLDSQREAVNKL